MTIPAALRLPVIPATASARFLFDVLTRDPVAHERFAAVVALNAGAVCAGTRRSALRMSAPVDLLCTCLGPCQHTDSVRIAADPRTGTLSVIAGRSLASGQWLTLHPDGAMGVRVGADVRVHCPWAELRPCEPCEAAVALVRAVADIDPELWSAVRSLAHAYTRSAVDSAAPGRVQWAAACARLGVVLPAGMRSDPRRFEIAPVGRALPTPMQRSASSTW